MRVTHGSLFNGIGGFQLAAEWMGWENVMSSEIDDFCNKVTNYYWPKCIQYGDIKRTDFTIWRGKIDVLSGGFPCQGFSTAGKMEGTAHHSYLWPEMFRAVREIRPRFVVAENVRGLVNWANGLVFERVQADLESEGYEVTSFLLPACGKNAPHRRYRIWFIAKDTYQNGRASFERQIKSCEWKFRYIGSGDNEQLQTNDAKTWPTSDTKCLGQSRSWQYSESCNTEKERNWQASWSVNVGTWPDESPLRTRDDGLSTDMVRSSIEAAGNAVVPQIVYSIFKALNL